MGRMIRALCRATTDSGLVFHGTASIRKGRAHLFLARSGGGKSFLATVCDAEKTPVLADEGALILEKDRGFFLRPLPRQTGVKPATVALGGETRLRRVFFLAKAPDPRIEEVAPTRAVARCLKEYLIFGFAEGSAVERQQLLDRLIRLFRTVPAYVLHFRKDNSFWKVIDELEEREKAERARA